MNEEIDLTDDDGEESTLYFPPLAQFGNGQETIPGLISSVLVDKNAAQPFAADGVVVIPRGEIQGGITSVQPGNGWSVNDGTVQVGYANGGSAGVISSATIAKITSKTPMINSGEIVFPLAQAGGHPESTTQDTPGAISGVEWAEGYCLSIVDGIIKIPKPPEQSYFPSGLYNAATGEKISWQTFLSGTSPVPMSQPTNGFRIMAFHLGEYLTFYLESA
jgi:hypothetical protein